LACAKEPVPLPKPGVRQRTDHGFLIMQNDKAIITFISLTSFHRQTPTTEMKSQ
jgi:hypothetical protein